MTDQPKSNMPVDKKEARIEYLEKRAKWHLFTFDLLASLGELFHNASIEGDFNKLFEETVVHLNKILDFEMIAFYMVDEESYEFLLKYIQPTDQTEYIESEIKTQINNGKFAWAINQNRPVLIKPQAKGKTLVLHVLSSKRRIRGMFVGVLEGKVDRLEEIINYPLSIILQNTSNSLESMTLYSLLQQNNEELEKKVRIRTQDLENNMIKLKEEIAYRKLAEESLWLAKEAAESATRTKSEFLANISHEIRTPLNAILGYSEILQGEAQKINREDFVSDLKTIDSAGKHLLGLINDILDLAKIHASKMNLFVEKFSLKTLLLEVAATLKPLAKKNSNTVEILIEDDFGFVVSDMTRVRQVLINLVGNACKFTKEGKISIECKTETRDQKPWVCISVSDTGIGVHPDQLEKLFEEFVQADNSRTRKYGGAGLGLPISRHLCRLLGGDIQASSEPGKGSTFSFNFPRELDNQLTDKSETIFPGYQGMSGVKPVKNPGVSRISNNSAIESDLAQEHKTLKCVLVVELGTQASEEIGTIMSKEGYQVVSLDSLESLIEHARNIKPTMVFVDLSTLGPEGESIVKALEENEGILKSRVILLGTLKEEIAFKGSGWDFIQKPLKMEALEAIAQEFRIPQSFSPILIVEDDASNREMLSRILKNEGWAVMTSKNGKMALDKIKEIRPGLVILDLYMEGMNGFEFLEEFKGDGVGRDIPVIVFTAKDLSENELQQLGGLVQKVIQKGNCTRGELLREVMEWAVPKNTAL